MGKRAFTNYLKDNNIFDEVLGKTNCTMVARFYTDYKSYKEEMAEIEKKGFVTYTTRCTATIKYNDVIVSTRRHEDIISENKYRKGDITRDSCLETVEEFEYYLNEPLRKAIMKEYNITDESLKEYELKDNYIDLLIELMNNGIKESSKINTLLNKMKGSSLTDEYDYLISLREERIKELLDLGIKSSKQILKSSNENNDLNKITDSRKEYNNKSNKKSN